jgi:Flp pilus assembly protein TadG
MSLNLRWARALRRMFKQSRGSMGVMIAVLIPVLIAFGSLAIDTANYGYHNLLLRQTVQSAALAAGNKLPTYFSNNGSTSLISTAATTFAQANMPLARYGTVVSGASVGTWNATNLTYTGGGTSPNAVTVTGTTVLPLIFGSVFGKPNITLTSTVVASYTTALPFNTIVINDMSQSFTSELSNQRTLDTAIANCVKGAAGSTSTFGITLINGHATIYQALSQVSTGLTSLLSQITGLTSLSCLLECSTGSNVAAGIYSARQQLSASAYNGQKKNIIIITDGVPNASSGVTYGKADGTYATDTATSGICTTHCTDADLLTMAQNQAALARAAGISISTVYYTGDTDTQDQAGYATSLATLVTGSGIAMTAPTSSQITASSAGFCATIPSALKTVM